MTQRIVNFNAKDLRPVSLVESRAFKEVTRKAQPAYILPTRKHLSSKLLQERYTSLLIQIAASSKVYFLYIRSLVKQGMSSFVGVGVTEHFILGLHVLKTSWVAHWGSDFINAMMILLQILKLQTILCQLLPIVMVNPLNPISALYHTSHLRAYYRGLSIFFYQTFTEGRPLNLL